MFRLATALLCLALAPSALAADPPGRVGRLGAIEGEVAVFTAPDQGWEPATLNAHLTSENSVWTEPGSRAEIRIGSTALSLGEATQLDLARLDDELLRAHVVRGSLAVRIRYFEKGDTYDITTPEARFQLRGNGRYRIDADAERGESRLTVFSGSARLESAGSYVQVDTGRAVRVTGGPQGTYEFEHARTTSLDEWAQARDERSAQRDSSRYVSPRMTGWEDLDTYGEWRNEPEYGSVWFPTAVDAGWAPYRYGRWTWVRPWGWSWVDDAPWGYAPFHYGRWVYAGNRWGWYPGRYTPRPVWAPALVGWVGSPGWSVSISANPTGLVGWYPLSPFDNYRPWYTANTTYVNHINRVVIVNRQPSHGHYNRDFGATVVARDVFAGQRPVHRNLAPVPREVVSAQPIHAGAALLPPRSEWRPRPGTPSVVSPTPGAPGSAAPRPYQGGGGTRPAAPSAPSSRPPPSTAPLVAPSASPSGRPAPAQAPSSAPSARPAPAQGSSAPSTRPMPASPPTPTQQFAPPPASAPGSAAPPPRTHVLVPATPSVAPAAQPPAPAQSPSRVSRPSYESGAPARPSNESRERREARPAPAPQPSSAPSQSPQRSQSSSAPSQSTQRSQPQGAAPSQSAPHAAPAQQAKPAAPQPKAVDKPTPKPKDQP